MSVLIKGMEMPKDGTYNIAHIYSDGRVSMPFWGKGMQIVQGINAIPVPPHGRLIDADELLERFNVLQKQKDMYGSEVSSCFEECGELCTEWWCVEEIVADAPTVIPADKDGEI